MMNIEYNTGDPPYVYKCHKCEDLEQINVALLEALELCRKALLPNSITSRATAVIVANRAIRKAKGE